MLYLVRHRRALGPVFGLALTLLCVPVGISLMEGCKFEPDKADPERQEVLRSLVSAVILPTLDALQTDSEALVQATQALGEEPAVDTLARAQEAFRMARGAWERSEAFHFGPVEDLAVTGDAIDSWPADKSKLDKLLAGNAAVDEQAAAMLGANLRGFPGLEHLLFDHEADEDALLARFVASGIGQRRAKLATSLALDLAERCAALRAAWGDGTDGYSHELAEAGVGSKLFDRQRAGIDRVVTGMLYLAELMVTRKLGKPLGLDTDNKAHPDLEQAPRSDGTLGLLRDNLHGLEAVYLGTIDDGRSLSEQVRKTNPGADMRFKDALVEALTAVDAVPSSFREALLKDRAALETVYDKVRAIRDAIRMELAGALGASIGFGYSDTD